MSDELPPPLPPPDPPPAGNEQQPNNDVLIQLGRLFFDKVDAIIDIVDAVMERRLRADEAESAFRIKMATIAVILVGLIVVAAAVMTYLGKLDGSTFGFLLGLVVGYVLTFIRDAITAGTEPSNS